MSEKLSPPPRNVQPLSTRVEFLIAGSQPLTRRTQFLILGAVTCVLLAGAGIGWLLTHWSNAPAGATPPVVSDGFRPTKEQWASLRIAQVEYMTFQTELIADGNIAYNDDTTTPVFSPYSGRITRLIAKPGDTVRQGAPLLTLEASEFAQGQNDLRTARAQLTLAQANENRQHELYLAKAGALKDWLQAQTELNTAQNVFAAARNRLHIFGISDAEIGALETASPKHVGAIATIPAPITGTVTQRQAGLGQFISAGASTPVYSIGDLSTVWLIANVRETDAPQLRINDLVDVRVLAYPGREFSARIAWVAPAVDAATHRLPVRAEVDNREGLLKPLMFASFTIRAGGEASAPAVPKSSVVYEGAEAHVFVARDDGSIALREIHVARTNGDMIEVTEGLAAGEKVVTGGTLFIDRALQADRS